MFKASLKPNISMRGLAKLLSWTVFGTLACVVVSVTYNYIVFRSFETETLHRALLSATVLPVAIAAPLFFYLTLKLRELAIVNHRLTDAASTDSLTQCLNRGAFTSSVNLWLAKANAEESTATGALLIIDADHFKSVNDRFGHQRGDEALKLISSTIKSAVRAKDLVGRLGGEEFGIFIPDTDPQRASAVAERIRQSIAGIDFAPDGMRWYLTVSVGVVVFRRPIEYADLFKIADERLYRAKELGRDRVESRRLIPDAGTATGSIH